MKFYTRKRRMPAVIIVSLIDILAILLIFVIVTTTFKSTQSQILIKLPESKSGVAEKASTNPLLLSISEKGELEFDGKSITPDKLRAELELLQKSGQPPAIALNADTKAPFGMVIKVIDVFKDAGIEKLPTFTETPGTDSSK
jgi:biopolymer transport protein ExbD